MSVRLPRLLDASFHERARLTPLAMSYQLRVDQTSMASMTLDEGDAALAMRDWVELYITRGSIGLYRVTNLQRRYKNHVTATLMHGIDTLSDSVWRARDFDYAGTTRGFLAQLLTYQTRTYWQLGTVEDTGSYFKGGIDYDRLSDLLWELAEIRADYYFDYDFTTTPWTLHFRHMPSNASSEWRLTRNMQSCQVTRSDEDMCNRLYLACSTTRTQSISGYTPEELDGRTVPYTGDDTLKLTDTTYTVYDNVASQAIYGIIEKTEDIESADVPYPAGWAAEYLRIHGEPAVQITVEGYELAAATGDSFDAFDLGKLTRCALPETGETLSERIVGITYPDPLGAPERCTVEMANRISRLCDKLKETSSTASSASATATKTSRGGGSSSKDQEHWSMVVKKAIEAMDGTGLTDLWETGIDLDAQGGARLYSLYQGEGESASGVLKVMNDDINARATKTTVNGLETRIGNAEIDINAAEAAITLKADQTTVTALGNRVTSAEIAIDGANANIRLKADASTVTSLGNRVSAAEISINGLESNITLKANTVDVDAITTRINNLTTGVTSATWLQAGTVWAGSSFVYRGSTCALYDCVDANGNTHRVLGVS